MLKLFGWFSFSLEFPSRLLPIFIFWVIIIIIIFLLILSSAGDCSDEAKVSNDQLIGLISQNVECKKYSTAGREVLLCIQLQEQFTISHYRPQH